MVALHSIVNGFYKKEIKNVANIIFNEMNKKNEYDSLNKIFNYKFSACKFEKIKRFLLV
jgi:hypothetical protein